MAAAFNVALHVPRLTQAEQKSVLQQLGAFSGPDVSGWGDAVGWRGPACGRVSFACVDALRLLLPLMLLLLPRCAVMALHCSPTTLRSPHPVTPQTRAPSLLYSLQLDAAVGELLEPEVPVKRLLLLLDLAKQGQTEEERSVPVTRWSQVLRDLAVA